jgi:hypothetical protein
MEKYADFYLHLHAMRWMPEFLEPVAIRLFRRGAGILKKAIVSSNQLQVPFGEVQEVVVLLELVNGVVVLVLLQ